MEDGEGEEKINSTQTETKWVAGDGARLSGLGLFRSTDIYRVADRSLPSSPWKVQTHTDPQRKCCGVRINALSHISLQASPPFLCVMAVTLPVCASVWFHVRLLPVSARSTTKGQTPGLIEKHSKALPVCVLCVCVSWPSLGNLADRQVGREVWEPRAGKGCWDGPN